VFENRVLMKIFGPKGDEVTRTGGGSVMRSFMISIQHQIFFNIKSVQMRCASRVASMGKRRDACRVLLGKPE
jgi:hypothetical protein